MVSAFLPAAAPMERPASGSGAEAASLDDLSDHIALCTAAFTGRFQCAILAFSRHRVPIEKRLPPKRKPFLYGMRRSVFLLHRHAHRFPAASRPPIGAFPRNRLAFSAAGGASPVSCAHPPRPAGTGAPQRKDFRQSGSLFSMGCAAALIFSASEYAPADSAPRSASRRSWRSGGGSGG